MRKDEKKRKKGRGRGRAKPGTTKSRKGGAVLRLSGEIKTDVKKANGN
jgi:hypothetical protein